MKLFSQVSDWLLGQPNKPALTQQNIKKDLRITTLPLPINCPW